MRGDRRTWCVALVGALVVLALAGGVMGAVAVTPAPAGDRTVRAAGDAVSGVAADAPVTTSTVVPVSTTLRPPPTAAPPVSRPAGHEEDHSWVKLGIDAFDDDGWMRTVTVDWGDGSPAQTFTGGIPCTVWSSGWPAPSRILVWERTTHHYLAPGSYTITVTALSTACDGVSAPQTGRRTVAWPVPA